MTSYHRPASFQRRGDLPKIQNDGRHHVGFHMRIRNDVARSTVVQTSLTVTVVFYRSGQILCRSDLPLWKCSDFAFFCHFGLKVLCHTEFWRFLMYFAPTRRAVGLSAKPQKEHPCEETRHCERRVDCGSSKFGPPVRSVRMTKKPNKSAVPRQNAVTRFLREKKRFLLIWHQQMVVHLCAYMTLLLSQTTWNGIRQNSVTLFRPESHARTQYRTVLVKFQYTSCCLKSKPKHCTAFCRMLTFNQACSKLVVKYT